MLLVQLADGRSLKFNLENEDELRIWRRYEEDGREAKNVRSVGIKCGKIWHVLPVPKRFRRIGFSAERFVDGDRAGERVVCYADDVRISLTVYNSSGPPMSRTDVERVGRRRFRPES